MARPRHASHLQGSNPSPAPNNGMHPTADTVLLIYYQRRGAAGDAERYAAVSPEGKHRICGPGGGDVIAPRPGSSGSWTPHNKRMHATRDTQDVIISRGSGGRVMRGVMASLPTPTSCGPPPRR